MPETGYFSPWFYLVYANRNILYTQLLPTPKSTSHDCAPGDILFREATELIQFSLHFVEALFNSFVCSRNCSPLVLFGSQISRIFGLLPSLIFYYSVIIKDEHVCLKKIKRCTPKVRLGGAIVQRARNGTMAPSHAAQQRRPAT